MWELTSRIQPFYDRRHDEFLMRDICSGLRPEIVEGTPECYRNLMESCWQGDPSRRPSSIEIWRIISRWFGGLYNANSIYYKIFEQAQEDENNFKSESTKNPDAYYISRPLNEYIESIPLDTESEEEQYWPGKHFLLVLYLYMIHLTINPLLCSNSIEDD